MLCLFDPAETTHLDYALWLWCSYRSDSYSIFNLCYRRLLIIAMSCLSLISDTFNSIFFSLPSLFSATQSIFLILFFLVSSFHPSQITFSSNFRSSLTSAAEDFDDNDIRSVHPSFFGNVNSQVSIQLFELFYYNYEEVSTHADQVKSLNFLLPHFREHHCK